MNFKVSIVFVCLLALAASFSSTVLADTCVMENGAGIWSDRAFTIVGLPEEFALGQVVPKQAFNKRTLEVPEGTRVAVIGIWKGAAEAYAKALDMRNLGVPVSLVNAKGQTVLKYELLAFRNPPKKLFFKNAGAGIMLIGLDIPIPQKKSRSYDKVYKGLDVEQTFVGQPWPFASGDREVKMYVREPRAGVNADTGFMLMSHNWGGGYHQVSSWCDAAADRYNVVAISVNYLQSDEGQVSGGIPYDHGYLQAIDCLRALYEVQKQLRDAGAAFNTARNYAVGISGGGNVTLMANKFAPHTFACITDVSGMPGLTDDIAYGIGNLNAGYSKDPKNQAYLTTDMQEIRNPGNRAHLKIQYQANPENKVVIIHGTDDPYCSVTDKVTIYRNMLLAGFRPDTHFLTSKDVDRGGVSNTGHGVGNRLQVIFHWGDDYYLQEGRLGASLGGKNDFELKSKISYPTTHGEYVIDYSQGPPTVSFHLTKK